MIFILWDWVAGHRHHYFFCWQNLNFYQHTLLMGCWKARADYQNYQGGERSNFNIWIWSNDDVRSCIVCRCCRPSYQTWFGLRCCCFFSIPQNFQRGETDDILWQDKINTICDPYVGRAFACVPLEMPFADKLWALSVLFVEVPLMHQRPKKTTRATARTIRWRWWRRSCGKWPFSPLIRFDWCCVITEE